MGQQAPLVIFGFDGGDADFIVRWAKEGHLPAMASILQHGCHGKTSGPQLLTEHGVWVPLFSGISRAKLGYYYFRQLKPGSYELQSITGLDIHADPFWSFLPERRVAVIDVPEIYPVPGVNGIQLCNWAPHFGWSSNHPAFQPWSEPKQLLLDVQNFFGPQIDILEKPESTFEEDRDIYNQVLLRVRKKGELCRHLISQAQYDVIVIVFTESHTAGHQFWKYRNDPESEMRDAIRSVYQAIDHEFGLLKRQLPEDANFVVLSSVGMTDFYPTGTCTENFCRELGYQAWPAPAPLSFHPMALARRILPESLRVALSSFLPRDTREQLLSQQFANGSDWNKTSAFAIPAFYNGLIRVNLKEREPSGTITYGAEYEDLVQRIESDLRLLVDPKTEKPAVKDVLRPGRIFGSDPPAVFPDLWVHYQPSDHFMNRLIHPQKELIQKRPEFFRNSDHSHEGFFAAAGPAFVTGNANDVEVLDLAPTFLSLCGAAAPPDMKGNVLQRLLRA